MYGGSDFEGFMVRVGVVGVLDGNSVLYCLMVVWLHLKVNPYANYLNTIRLSVVVFESFATEQNTRYRFISRIG